MTTTLAQELLRVVLFASAFVLLGRQMGDHRLAGRIEYFAANDRDGTLGDPNKERGAAATLAWG